MSQPIHRLRHNRILDRHAARHVKQSDTSRNQNTSPSMPSMDVNCLVEDNIRYMGTGGVSENNRNKGFCAAFRDDASGAVVLARFPDGSPAPMHLLDGLPEDWIVERSHTGRVISVKPSVVAGFVRRGRFYTREEAARAIQDR